MLVFFLNNLRVVKVDLGGALLFLLDRFSRVFDVVKNAFDVVQVRTLE